MNKFLRNCMTAGVLALGLAACGDDVTVTQPPAPPAVPNITSFSVAPAAVTLTVGQVVQASYNLQLAPGLTGTVAYISGTSSVATIDATGKITAVAVGTSVVTATATSGGQTSVATIGVTVIAAPVVDAIQDFTVSPTSVTMIAGTTTQASYNLQLAPGLSGAVTWGPSTVASVATINASGVITAVGPGTAAIPVTATSAGQTSTVTIGVTVVAVTPASLSIASVTQGLLTLPVNLSNVNGQIEINLNFSPGGQQIDSIVSYIGTKRAAVQAFSSSATPTAGVISMSVNTANFRKNFSQAGVATAGATQVDFLNGPTTVNAIVYPKAITGQSAGNCTNAPPGVPAVCSSNTFSIVLNNSDSWAADMTKPTSSAVGNSGSAAVGQTFWGGPDATTGMSTATLYPVIYTPGRSVSTVTWGISGCPTVAQTALPFTRSWASGAATGVTACGGYEWTAGARNNVNVVSAIDNAANAFGAFAGLIPNTVVFNSTPDSMRLDYKGPASVTAPLYLGANGFAWVNASWAFKPGGSPAPTLVTDGGVGPLATSWASTAILVADTTVKTPVVTGADLPETNTNTEYRVRASATDLLGNANVSSIAGTFGIDKVIPTVRYPTTTTLASVAVYAPGTDTLTAVTAPALTWAVEAIDNRSGLFDAPNGGYTVGGVAPKVYRLFPGATSTTAKVSSAGDSVYQAVLLDGYRQTKPIPVWGSSGGTNATSGYYTYTITIRDRAGNAASLANIATDTLGTQIAQRRYAIDNAAPVAVGLTMPFTFGTNNVSLAASFQFSASDDLEVIGSRLGLNYTTLTGAPFVFPTASNLGVKYDGTLAGAIAQVSALTTPVLGTLVAPDFWAGVQILCGGACVPTGDLDGGLGEPVVAGATYKPISVQAQASDVFGTLSAPTTSNILPGSLNATAELPANTYAGGCAIAQCNILTGIQVRYFSGTTIRQVSPFSVTLPQLDRLHAFLLVGGEWVYQGTVLGSAGVGSDNGLERFWDYNFGSVMSAAGTYGIMSVYNGPVSAARGTALWFTVTK